MACKEYDMNQLESGKSILAAGFKLDMIGPFNPSPNLPLPMPQTSGSPPLPCRRRGPRRLARRLARA